MARLKVIAASVNFYSGSIGLTVQQAQDRRHNLESLGGDRYNILHTITFKRGEEVEFEGLINKAMLSLVAPAPAAAEEGQGKGDPKTETPPTIAEQVEQMTKAQLIAYAAGLGLQLPDSLKKEELLTAVKVKVMVK